MKKLFSVNHNRNGAIDIYRLIFAYAIMHVHLFNPEIPFIKAGIYVEFFFMMTGAYTARKFLAKDYSPDCAVDYTFNKFKKFIPYVFIATLLQYTSEYISFIRVHGGFDIRELINYFEAFIADNLLLYSAGIPAHDSPLWFLSAMFIVFPLFVWLVIKFGKNPLFYKYLSWLIPAIYYGRFGVNVHMDWPTHMLRAFSDLMLGVFVNWLSMEVGKIENKRISTITSLSSLAAVIITIAITYINTGNDVLNIFCYIVALVCLLSGKCWSEKLHLPGFVGEMSMMVYLFHWPTMVLLSALNTFSFKKYFVFTFAIGFAVLVFVTFMGDVLHKNRAKNH